MNEFEINSQKSVKNLEKVQNSIQYTENNDYLYKISGLGKTYSGVAEDLTILKDINLLVEEGETVAVLGASGSGKSTLLHLLGTLDIPTVGTIYFNGRNLCELSPEARAALRNRELGFVFQFHYLLPEFNTRENVAMQAIIGGMNRADALERADAALELVGLAERRQHPVSTLSGGERQRAAIARAMLNNPKVLLADEPTGNLDEATGRKIAELLLDLNARLRTTLIIVTHNLELAAMMGRRLELRAGDIYDRKS